MLDALGLQFLILHITLERVDFGYRVRYGRAGQEVDAAPFILALQIAALDEQIEGLGRAGDIAQTGNIHGRLIGKILEFVTFIHREYCIKNVIMAYSS